jgi:hypothetical protein
MICTIKWWRKITERNESLEKNADNFRNSIFKNKFSKKHKERIATTSKQPAIKLKNSSLQPQSQQTRHRQRTTGTKQEYQEQ